MAEDLRVYEPVGMAERLGRLGRNWGWFLVAGIFYVIAGFAAFAWPVRSSVGLAFALGVLFTVAGVVQVVQGIRLRNEAGNGWHFLQGVVALAAGILMLRYPGAGMVGIAIAMTFYFFVSAAAKFIISLGMRPHQGWGWAFFSAVCSFVLGAFIIATFPVSALWLPGAILGIDFVIYGFSLISYSFIAKRTNKTISELEESIEGRKAA